MFHLTPFNSELIVRNLRIIVTVPQHKCTDRSSALWIAAMFSAHFTEGSYKVSHDWKSQIMNEKTFMFGNKYMLVYNDKLNDVHCSNLALAPANFFAVSIFFLITNN